MDPGIEMPIIALCFKIEIGYYDKLRGQSCIVTPTEDGGGSVVFCYEILPPPTSQCMIVYNGENRFSYLSCNSRDTTPFRGTSIDDNDISATEKRIFSSDKDYYLPYAPDYTSCEIFIRAIGYDIDTLSLIGHRVLLSRSSFKNKGTAWQKEQKNVYTSLGRVH